MVDNPQEGRLSRKRKKLKETFEESCGEESHCLFALNHVCHLEDTQCTSSGLVASTLRFPPNVNSNTGRFYFRVAHSCKIAREHQFYLHLQISLTEIDAVSFIVVDCGYSTEIALQVSEVVIVTVKSVLELENNVETLK
ncbi:hypothetical protein QQG55_28620 [Brugia pahangi]